MNEAICEFKKEFEKYNVDGWQFNVHFHSCNNRKYRDKIVMFKTPLDNEKSVCIIMFNPGKFHSKKSEIDGDISLRNIRKVFKNLNCKIIILNLFNLNETKIKRNEKFL